MENDLQQVNISNFVSRNFEGFLLGQLTIFMTIQIELTIDEAFEILHSLDSFDGDRVAWSRVESVEKKIRKAFNELMTELAQ